MKRKSTVLRIIENLKTLYPDALCSLVYEKDYEGLINRPHINGVELIGNKSFEELGDQELTNMEILSLLKMAGF